MGEMYDINCLQQIFLNCSLFKCMKHRFTHCIILLQSKKTGGEAGNKEAEDAEMLLLNNKPLTDLTSLLTQLVGKAILLLNTLELSTKLN